MRVLLKIVFLVFLPLILLAVTILALGSSPEPRTFDEEPASRRV